MKNNRLAYENVKNFIEVESNSGCKLESKEYIRSKNKLELRCKCGESFETTFDKFKSQNKRQCNKCSMKNMPQCQPKGIETFKKEVSDLVGDEYEVVGEYKKGGIKIQMKHNICNKIFEITPNHFLNGNRCSFCYVCRHKTNDEFMQEVFDITKDEYKFLGIYKNNHTKIPVIHTVCEHEYNVTPKDFLRGNRCPKCNESKGEKLVRMIMESNLIPFTHQYIFEDLLSDKNNPLKFDFVIFEDEAKTKLKYILEYDGEFHFKEQYEGDSHETIKYHDELKNNYCSKNNIPLLRIPYWEFDNIESIISNYISELDNQ